jgi:hypothetical protein
VSNQLEVRVVKSGAFARTAPLSGSPITLGRAPSNDIVLQDDMVSWHHAMIWREGEALWVKDLGSRNGTFVGDEQVQGQVQVAAESVIRLGPNVSLALRVLEVNTLTPKAFVLEALDSKMQHPLREDRFVIGSAPDADLRTEDGPEEAAVLLLPTLDEVWLGVDGEDRELQPDEEFTVGGRRFAVREAAMERAATVEPDSDRYPYSLRATLNGATGPEAWLKNDRSGQEHHIAAENRAVLLYLLAKRVADDAASGIPASQRGWCTDVEVAKGIWGRSSKDKDTNSLHVLVYRLRRELKRSGFDGWFIEKRKRYIRARVASAALLD